MIIDYSKKPRVFHEIIECGRYYKTIGLFRVETISMVSLCYNGAVIYYRNNDRGKFDAQIFD